MPKNEPQSYGSQGDWVSGKTGEQANRQKSEPESHPDFYDPNRNAAEGPNEGGLLSEVQLAESRQPIGPRTGPEDLAGKKVTDVEGGARRDSYFKRRDYGR